jgi:hypothetical protein
MALAICVEALPIELEDLAAKGRGDGGGPGVPARIEISPKKLPSPISRTRRTRPSGFAHEDLHRPVASTNTVSPGSPS